MSRFLFSLICIYSPIILSSYAFTFQEGSTYVIFSGYSNFDGICLQGSRGYFSANAPLYTYKARTKETHSQEWIFECASTTDTMSFYIYNVGTGKYLGESEEIGKYSLPRNADKASAVVWTITPIYKDQVLINCTDRYGVHRFLHATDTTSTSYPTIKSSLPLNRNSRFAWIITPLGKGLDGIQSVSSTSLHVYVKNRQILVEGTDNYSIYRTDGLRVSHNMDLQPGTYIVTTDKGSYKIAVP